MDGTAWHRGARARRAGRGNARAPRDDERRARMLTTRGNENGGRTTPARRSPSTPCLCCRRKISPVLASGQPTGNYARPPRWSPSVSSQAELRPDRYPDPLPGHFRRQLTSRAELTCRRHDDPVSSADGEWATTPLLLVGEGCDLAETPPPARRNARQRLFVVLILVVTKPLAERCGGGAPDARE